MTAGDGLPRGELRPLTKRLAELFASESGTLALAQMQKLALLAGPREEQKAIDTGLQIGIWAPAVREDGTVEFVRSRAHTHEWRYWADVDRIPAKAGPRVVLLGESVARGYLFDPSVTPAGVLSMLLGGVEVVDLARTDLGLPGLRALFDGLPALEPDAIVLFAGNNWYSLVFELEDLDKLAGALRRDGYAGYRRVFLDEILMPRARAVLDALAQTAAEFALPVVVVVPEFNLLDWRAEASAEVPVLPRDANLRWLDTRRQAERALAGGDRDDALRLALELCALDGGTSPVGPSLAAAARPAEARVWRERARDALVGVPVAHSPRCPAVVQALLRERSAQHGFKVVDLPRLFDGGGARLPGRDLFLDYCHLTLEGIRAAMTAVAHEVAPIVGVSVRTDARLDVEPEHEGAAHFMAAIHNAHYGQSDDILAHHCSRAAALSPRVRDLMRDYLRCASRWPEPWLCEAFARLCESPIARRYLLAPEVRNQKIGDFGLMEAVMRALDAHGLDARPEVGRLLKADYAAADPVDLLDPHYRAFTFRDRGGYALAAERAFLRATDLVSRFALVRALAGTVRLEITCRARVAGEVRVRLNGQACGVLRTQPVWATSTVTVTAREGLNWIELEWPPSAPPADEIERAARKLERGLYPDVLPAYAEIHALTASAA